LFRDQHAHPAGEGGRAVGQHRHLLDALVLRPAEHDEGVVDAQADHLVDTERDEVVVQLLVARQVGLGAGRREGARQGEQHDPAAAENVGGSDFKLARCHDDCGGRI